MPKRNLPQARIDETVFPVRVNLFVPENGFGTLLGPIFAWLDGHCGPTGYAWHGGHGVAGRDTVAIYFRRAEDPAAFAAAWPELELADGTGLARYRHPRAGETGERRGAAAPRTPRPEGAAGPLADLPREYFDLSEDQASGEIRPRPRK